MTRNSVIDTEDRMFNDSDDVDKEATDFFGDVPPLEFPGVAVCSSQCPQRSE